MSRLIFSLQQSPQFVDGTRFANGDLARVPSDAVVLTLEGSAIDDEGLSNLPPLESIRCLDLDSTKVSDRGLAKIASLSSLEELWLECTAVTDYGLLELRRLPNLKFVSVAYTNATASGIAALVEANPGVEVVS